MNLFDFQPGERVRSRQPDLYPDHAGTVTKVEDWSRMRDIFPSGVCVHVNIECWVHPGSLIPCMFDQEDLVRL